MNEAILALLDQSDQENYSFAKLLEATFELDMSECDEESRLALAGALVGTLIDELCSPKGPLANLENPERALAHIASAIHGNNPLFYLDNTMTMAGVLMGTGEVQISEFANMIKRAYAVAEDVRKQVLLGSVDTSNPQ